MSGNSIYSLLNFPSNDPLLNQSVETFSDKVQYQMNLMPALVNTWQQNDIATNDTDGYFHNPVQTTIQNLWNSANNLTIWNNYTVSAATQDIVTLVNNTLSVANNISVNTANSYMLHTDRMSNVTELNENVELPHYQTAIGFGKMITYITNKTDNVQNNSVLIGSFGSIISANSFNANANISINFMNYFANTLSIDETENVYCSISLSNAQSLYASVSSINDEMWNRRQQDIDFFTNTKTVIERYNNVNQFNNIGQTETNLIMNYIGTDKIKTRLNS